MGSSSYSPTLAEVDFSYPYRTVFQRTSARRPRSCKIEPIYGWISLEPLDRFCCNSSSQTSQGPFRHPKVQRISMRKSTTLSMKSPMHLICQVSTKSKGEYFRRH